MSPQFPFIRKVVCGQSNNHSVKWHEERTSLPRRQQKTRLNPSVWRPTIPSNRVSLAFLFLWTKMSEFLFFFPVLKMTQADVECVCSFLGGGTDNLGRGRPACFVKQVPFCQSRGLEWYLPSPSAPQHRGRGLQPWWDAVHRKCCISLVCQFWVAAVACEISSRAFTPSQPLTQIEKNKQKQTKKLKS